MKVNYEFSAKVSDVVKPESPLPPEQDQKFELRFLSTGILSLKFFSHEDESKLMSRISLPIYGTSAVEVFVQPGMGFWLMRVAGAQVPVVLPETEMSKLMDAIDSLEV